MIAISKDSPMNAPTQTLTVRSLLSGFALSLLLCAVNSYLTLSFGVIEEGPTIAALFFFAFFFLSKTKITSTEMVIVATMGSAGGSLGFITNFYAAQVMVGVPYSLFQMIAFATVTSVLGLLFTIPLRELLILKEDLPWVGSKATYSVIQVLTEKGDPRQPYYLLGVGVAALAYVVGNNDGGFGFFPAETAIGIFGLAAYSAGIAWSPFAIGGAYLMGFRTCVGFLVGGIALLVIAPNLPDPSAPHRYIWPGMGFLLSSGLTLMAINWRVITESIRSLLALGGKTEDDDPILAGKKLAAFAVFAIVLTLVFGFVFMKLNFVLLLVLIVIGGGLQNVIATRAAAQTAFNPARAMGALLQGACAAVGGANAAVNLAGAGFVAGSGAQAGNLTGDLAYGRWLKVPARWQFWAQSSTVIPCAIISGYVFTKIHELTPLALEGGQHPAPVAKMWAATALIFDGSRPMPPFAVEAMLIGAAIGVVYVLLEENKTIGRYLPGSVGLGIGLVLPVSYDFAFFLGGLILWIVMGRWMKVKELTLTTIAVACIVAEGIGGVMKPFLTIAGVIKP
jgi:uncharacterized oligopeptide transporter (OPT) family protein